MRALTRTWPVAIGLALGLPLLAKEAGEGVELDQPVRVEKDLFHPPVRLTTADGVIDSGPSGGHSGPRVVDVDGVGTEGAQARG
jgi:hypothetical protein